MLLLTERDRFFVKKRKGSNASKMYKELVICIILVVIIFTLDSITQNYTKNSTNDMKEKLEILKEQVKNKENKQEKQKLIEEVYLKWEKFHDISAIYIEHNELEKVETNFVSCKDFIDQEIYDMASNEIEKVIFGLEHIKDKYAFSLINIF